jgi:predicted nucleic acid-binding Zn ribbon protein
MSAQPIEVCPKCGGKVKRLIGTGAGPIFKGKGFYQTDYKNSGKSASEDFKKSEKKSSGESSNKNATDKK